MLPQIFTLAITIAAAPFAECSQQSEALVSDVDIGAEEVQAAARLVGLTFTEEEIELMLPDLKERLAVIDELRELELDNGTSPALVFSPRVPGMRAPFPMQAALSPPEPKPNAHTPGDDALYFASIAELSHAIRTRRMSCVELTEAYIARLKRLDEHLHCVIHFCEERALAQARALDAELEDGKWRGLLHGIPWGVKDLMSVPGTPTTWGATPFKDQELEETAEVVQRLDDAGAVLIAKLSVGALAWGDVWFGERTRSPWNPERGSSGSSAGSASATAAGGVAFALGTETLGSIVSPSVVCATSALRPTFGRVSRRGTMALCWSMDKVGPITRSLEDAAIVFAAIEGRDPMDPSSRDSDVRPGQVGALAELRGGGKGGALRIAVIAGTRKEGSLIEAAAQELEALAIGPGVEVVEVILPEAPMDGMLLTLGAEAAAAFDGLTRSGKDDELVRQVRNAWPNVFRVARSLPAVEYIQAQRFRSHLMVDVDALFAPDDEGRRIDAILHTPYAGGILGMTNLTGNPTVVVPFVGPRGPRRDGSPSTLCLTAPIDHDEALMALGIAWQRAHPEHALHPALEFLEPR